LVTFRKWLRALSDSDGGPWLAFRGVALYDLATAFAEIRRVPIIVAYGVAVTGCGLRGVQLHFVLRHVRDVSIWRLLSLMIGFLVSYLFIARAGEVIRAGVTSRREEIAQSTVLAERGSEEFSRRDGSGDAAGWIVDRHWFACDG